MRKKIPVVIFVSKKYSNSNIEYLGKGMGMLKYRRQDEKTQDPAEQL
jgi:hypothetical protein